MKNHVVITGTGRTGSTFLVQLLTHLNFDTGWTDPMVHYGFHEYARAGLEHNARNSWNSYIIKTPEFYSYAEDKLKYDNVIIDHIFVPMRDLHAAAESRRYVVKNTPSDSLKPFPFVPGGLSHTDDGDAQEYILLLQIYKLMLVISKTDIPLTLLNYPRIVKDCDYLYRKLTPILKDIRKDQFSFAFRKIVRLDLVHSFNENDK